MSSHQKEHHRDHAAQPVRGGEAGSAPRASAEGAEASAGTTADAENQSPSAATWQNAMSATDASLVVAAILPPPAIEPLRDGQRTGTLGGQAMAARSGMETGSLRSRRNSPLTPTLAPSRGEGAGLCHGQRAARHPARWKPRLSGRRASPQRGPRMSATAPASATTRGPVERRRAAIRFDHRPEPPTIQRDCASDRRHPRTTAVRVQILGSVTPCWPWYLPPRSLYDVSHTSSDSKKITCATPSLA